MPKEVPRLQTNHISHTDMGKARRLMILNMKKVVPKPLSDSERYELADLTVEFNSKYPTWMNGFNFLTGEITEK